MQLRRIVFAQCLGFFALAALVGAAGPVNETDGVAIKGYDPVAYFTQGRAVRGLPDITAADSGVTYRFADTGDRALFVADPAHYRPEFGGYCAFGTSRGYKADIDPQAFSIIEGKLYLNYSLKVQQTWRGDIPAFLAKARANWQEVEQKPEVTR